MYCHPPTRWTDRYLPAGRPALRPRHPRPPNTARSVFAARASRSRAPGGAFDLHQPRVRPNATPGGPEEIRKKTAVRAKDRRPGTSIFLLKRGVRPRQVVPGNRRKEMMLEVVVDIAHQKLEYPAASHRSAR